MRKIGNENEAIPEFTLEQFENGEAFEFLYNIKNTYDQARAENILAKQAVSVKYKAFKRTYREYVKNQTVTRALAPQGATVTCFDGFPLSLDLGLWTADETGIYKWQNGRLMIACSHPIAISKILRGMDSGAIQYEIWYRLCFDLEPKTVVVEATDISNANRLVERLAPLGISVIQGERANMLMDYLLDQKDKNAGIIPVQQSITRMGWLKGHEGFAPYVTDVSFDGSATVTPIYKTIHSKGDFELWRGEALEARTYSLTARILLAASFASALVEPMGTQSFFVHLWGGTGTGKTVASMLAAAVWAYPVVGGPFFPTFKGTSVGFEVLAGFLHSIPLFIDDLQLARDKHGSMGKFDVYELASGAGKLRSNRSLGINYHPGWSNCFITTGETPMINPSDGGGAVNRVIEIECMEGGSVIHDGHKTAGVVKQNYGFAGKIFVEKLLEPGQMDRARELYDQFYRECLQFDATGKQSTAAADILTADALATEWIFKDDRALTAKEVSVFLKNTSSVSMSERGYAALTDWVMINKAKFRADAGWQECYGLLDNGTAYIINSVFDKACADNGFNAKVLKSYFRKNHYIDAPPNGFTRSKRIDGQPTNCVCLIMPKEEELNPFDEESGLPL